MGVKFSVLVVCLNPGDKLEKTIRSILMQTYRNYEVIVKDGGSADGSVAALQRTARRERLEQIRIIVGKDRGIYDAMNEAVKEMTGDYCLFLNCGDYFYSETVLEKFAEAICGSAGTKRDGGVINLSAEQNHIFYGNRYQAASRCVEYSAPQVDAFVCYRNIPCHQTCFYSKDLFGERGYLAEYKVRADYEHFLWCYFVKKAAFTYVPECVVSYEGGGYSETKENVKQSAEEHREITRRYMTRGQRFRYRAFLVLTLAPLRHFLASNPRFADAYNSMVKRIYRR